MPLFLFWGFFFFFLFLCDLLFLFLLLKNRTELSYSTYAPSYPLCFCHPIAIVSHTWSNECSVFVFSGDTNIVHIWVKQYIFSFLEKNHRRKQVAKILKKQLHPNPKLYKNIIYIKIKKYLSQNARMGRHDKTIVVYYKNVIKRKMTW